MDILSRYYRSMVHTLTVAGSILVLASTLAFADAEKPEPPPPVAYHPLVHVQGSHIRLGDLFTSLEKYADRVVARAPEPGQEMILPATWLWQIAKTFGVDWRPSTTEDFITVIRPSTVISSDHIGGLLRDAYFHRTGQDDLVEMETAGAALRMDIPVTAEPSARIDRFDMDNRSGRFTATVVAPAVGKTLQRLHVSGRFYRMVEIPVPVTRLGKGHIISKNDLLIRRLREKNLGTNLIVDADQLVGQAVRRSLKGGSPVRVGDVHAPVLVEKNRIVIVSLRTEGMILTVQGRALEDGAMNDVIRVRNTQSSNLIDAIVTGPGRVSVYLNQPLTMASE